MVVHLSFMLEGKLLVANARSSVLALSPKDGPFFVAFSAFDGCTRLKKAVYFQQVTRFSRA